MQRSRARRPATWSLRAEAVAQRSHALVATDLDRGEQTVRAMADPGDLVEDDLLRLVLMCAHPALTPASAVALTLRAVGGLTTRQIARAFLVPEDRKSVV